MMQGPVIGPASAGAPAHAFVVDLEAAALAPEDRHHLRRVLRLRPGTEITVADGVGRWRRARLTGTEVLEPTGAIVVDPPPAPAVAIGFALVKGERPEWIAQKLTEVGVDRIVPFTAERSVVRWDPDRAARATERLRRAVREAAMQCRRSRLPEVVAPASSLVAAVAAAGSSAVLASADGDRPALDHPTVLVGPEGGWSAAELGGPWARITLGPHVLRAETAAMVAGSLLVAMRSRLVDGHVG